MPWMTRLPGGFPLFLEEARGGHFTDVDGREYVDFCLGDTGAMTGHALPQVAEAIHHRALNGITTMLPNEDAQWVAAELERRFGLPKWQFAMTATDANRFVLRFARELTGRPKIAVMDWCYHGTVDETLVIRGENGETLSRPGSTGRGFDPAITTRVVPFNDIEELEKVLVIGDVACLLMEPALTNIGIVLPDAGYLERVRELCDQYGIVLIFDEVKTGLTAGHQGAAQRLGVQPDLITLAKSIGGGLTLAAFGGKKKYMDFVTNGKMAHFGTFNGNPLAMAGIRAVDKICTAETLAAAEAFNQQALDRITEIIEEFQLPAHTVGFGVKGCITWSIAPVRNYRDYKATDFAVAELSWLWSLNRGIITPPGLDEQWLISLAHGQKEIDILVEDFRSFAVALRS